MDAKELEKLYEAYYSRRHFVDEPTPDAICGELFRWQLKAAGGVPPYTFTIVSGALPPGLSMTRSGLISGVATESGDLFVVKFAVDDSTSRAADDPE